MTCILLVVMKNGTAILENSLAGFYFFKKLNMQLPYNPTMHFWAFITEK